MNVFDWRAKVGIFFVFLKKISKMIEGIQHIIFDLGGVILNIDYQRPIAAFKALGAKKVDDLYSKQTQTALFDLLETGKISESDFFDALAAFCPPGTTHHQLETAWK